MADANPATQADPGQPAPATEILMPPVEKAEVVVQAPAKVDPKEIQKLVKAAESEGKSAMVIGNAVRVDN